MRSLLLSSMMLVATGLLHAQALPTPIPELTNVEEFSSRSGTLIQREFTRVGDFSGVRVDVVRVSDLIGKTSVQGVRISANVGANAGRDTVFLDADELDTFLKATALMRTAAFSTTPDSFTDVTYRTRGGITIGAVYANTRWNPYMRLDRFDAKSALNVDQNEIESLRDLIAQAKERIK